MRSLSLVLLALAIGCQITDPDADDSSTNGAVTVTLGHSSLLIAAPGEARANVRIEGPAGHVVEDVSPELSVTGSVSAAWASSRWQARSIVITATAPGSGRVIVSARGAADTIDVTAVTVAFRQVDLTAGNACGIATDSTAWCWGGNDSGQLGAATAFRCDGSVCQYGSTFANASPLKVGTTEKFTQVSVASTTCGDFVPKQCGASCALTPAGEVWCWGQGFGTPVRAAPGYTFASLVMTPAFSSSHCGLAEDGKAFCFTRNAVTVLADGMPFTALARAATHSCGISAGDIWCWGTNYYGSLGIGNGDASSYTAPQRVTTNGDFVAVDDGYYATCALDRAGQIHCWGPGWADDGVSPPTDCATGTRCQATPRVVEGGRGYVAISMVFNQLCARTASGEVDCWRRAFNHPPTPEAPEPAGACPQRSAGAYCWGTQSVHWRFPR